MTQITHTNNNTAKYHTMISYISSSELALYLCTMLSTLIACQSLYEDKRVSKYTISCFVRTAVFVFPMIWRRKKEIKNKDVYIQIKRKRIKRNVYFVDDTDAVA